MHWVIYYFSLLRPVNHRRARTASLLYNKVFPESAAKQMYSKKPGSWVWWHMLVILALEV